MVYITYQIWYDIAAYHRYAEHTYMVCISYFVYAFCTFVLTVYAIVQYMYHVVLFLKVSLIEHMKMSEVNMIFYDLIDYLYLHLAVTEKLSFNLAKKCRGFNPLFNEQWFKRIGDYKSFYLFKIYLLPLITWLDHSILNQLVAASGSEDAQHLLDLFNSKIDSYNDQPITSFPILTPSQLMIPLDNSEYTLLAMKFRPPPRGGTTQEMIILQDVINIKLIMKRKWKICDHNIQLVAVQTELELLYWMISKCGVKAIESNLVPDLKSGIIMMSVLPTNLHSIQNNNEILNGPFSSLNILWQDNTKVNM